MRRDDATAAPGPEPGVTETEGDPVSRSDDADARVDALAELARPEASAAPAAPRRLTPGLRTAELEGVLTGRLAAVRLRGALEAIPATLAPEVDRELVIGAAEAGQSALVEIDEAGAVWVVGVVQTRIPERLVLRADTVLVQGDTEVLLQSGKAGMRLREDGDVELVGSRIMHMSRGLFRIVGRMLRLN